jgi:hypothetical protein
VDGRSIAGCERASELRASGRLRAQVPTERIRGRLRGRPLRGSSKRSPVHNLATPQRSCKVEATGAYEPLVPVALAALPEYAPVTSESQVRVAIPGDIDGLLASDPAQAHEWRHRLRKILEAAFASRYAITGFAGRRGESRGYYLLERDFMSE